MKKTALIYVIMSLVFAGIGGVGGWCLARKSDGAGRLHAAHGSGGGAGHDDEHDHSLHADDEHGAGGISFSAATLASMGVTIEEIGERTFFVYESVPAVVAETPLTEQPLVAPISGWIDAVIPRLGQLVDSGAVVVHLVRDALPRPSLSLTEDLLKPATEDFHSTKSELRTALKAKEILDSELSRLGRYGDTTGEGLPLVPRQNLINLRYERAKVEQEIDNLRRELRLHGLSEEQIRRVEAGQTLDLNLLIWQAILARNGVWNDDADRLLSLLSDGRRERPWVIATVGELITQDLLSADLISWLQADPHVAENFIHVAGMLLEGQSLVAIRQLATLGALEPVVRVRVPTGTEDWDVHAVHVRLGQHVDAGEPLLTLADSRKLYLEARPVGGEIVALLRSLQEQTPIEAVPLVADTGPVLGDVRLQGLTGEEDQALARLVVENRVQSTTKDGDGRGYRSWALRPGLRYMLRVPVRKLEKVFVVPADAVIEQGAARVVYLQNGDAFAPVPVVVAYANYEVAVLGPGSEVFPGDFIVTGGAFALNLALRAGDGGAIDPHAGHNH